MAYSTQLVCDEGDSWDDQKPALFGPDCKSDVAETLWSAEASLDEVQISTMVHKCRTDLSIRLKDVGKGSWHFRSKGTGYDTYNKLDWVCPHWKGSGKGYELAGLESFGVS